MASEKQVLEFLQKYQDLHRQTRGGVTTKSAALLVLSGLLLTAATAAFRETHAVLHHSTWPRYALVLAFAIALGAIVCAMFCLLTRVLAKIEYFSPGWSAKHFEEVLEDQSADPEKEQRLLHGMALDYIKALKENEKVDRQLAKGLNGSIACLKIAIVSVSVECVVWFCTVLGC